MDELASEAREKIGNSSMKLMDAMCEETFTALGDALGAAEKAARVLHEQGVPRINIASLIVGGAANVVFTTVPADDD